MNLKGTRWIDLAQDGVVQGLAFGAYLAWSGVGAHGVRDLRRRLYAGSMWAHPCLQSCLTHTGGATGSEVGVSLWRVSGTASWRWRGAL
jgi:hypothetical protein